MSDNIRQFPQPRMCLPPGSLKPLLSPPPITREVAAALLAFEMSTGQISEDSLRGAIDLLKADAARAAGRAKGARVLARERQAYIGNAIREAIGVLPLDRDCAGITRKRISQAGPDQYGLTRVPSLRRIRQEIARMKLHGRYATVAP